ncbi:hypothetical protein B2J93_3435 [Marssonina coronariae]|uniref:Uncharacterized protein n=1 Tax=Diplocarpon coronariae TaxID=2795749 RepID=A0A218Z6H9_9HELO|nr:hypothetical protein B2J93_3435 [Marssonina coronariae]
MAAPLPRSPAPPSRGLVRSLGCLGKAATPPLPGSLARVSTTARRRVLRHLLDAMEALCRATPQGLGCGHLPPRGPGRGRRTAVSRRFTSPSSSPTTSPPHRLTKEGDNSITAHNPSAQSLDSSPERENLQSGAPGVPRHSAAHTSFVVSHPKGEVDRA